MYLTAHRVLFCLEGLSGVNAFWYTHQNSPLPEPLTLELPEENLGHLLSYKTAISPVGNRVVSYLDIVCSDDCSLAEVEASFRTFIQQFRRTRLPWSSTQATCLFRFDLDANLAAVWPEEIEELFETAISVRKGSLPSAESTGEAQE